jgi:REP element-mobilizing transposase RayT
VIFYRRNLPHWQPEGKAIFLTWRLFGSLPSTGRNACATFGHADQDPRAAMHRQECLSHSTDWGRKFRMIDAELDRGAFGPAWLHNREIAAYVETAIIRGAKLGCFVLHAYVVMPNHVHLLVEPRVSLRRITAGIKGTSARYANAALGRVGRPFWQDESFDHWIRNEAGFQRICTYVERNPVIARLVKRPGDWPWSSASKREGTQTQR